MAIGARKRELSRVFSVVVREWSNIKVCTFYVYLIRFGASYVNMTNHKVNNKVTVNNARLYNSINLGLRMVPTIIYVSAIHLVYIWLLPKLKFGQCICHHE